MNVAASAMDWGRLLDLRRLGDSDYQPQPHRPIYQQDIDRIVFSQPFRRLANKTQVHPLHDNDHIHHRLIHSLEVASVGRSIATEIGAWLVDEHRIEGSSVEVIAGLVQTACMAHDIGNPPFGHSGEEAIASWFRDRFVAPSGILADLAPDERHEFAAFEGNAQGFRILTRTEMYRNAGGLRLAQGALGAFSKYPVAAADRHRIAAAGGADAQYIGLKKYGFFQNDAGTFAAVAERMGLPEVCREGPDGVWARFWRRHPLCFIMEAADDICYNVMDLEDASTCGDIDSDTVKSHLRQLWEDPDKPAGTGIAPYRARAIGGAVAACAAAFRDNYEAIMAGSLSRPLIAASGKAAAFGAIREISKERIFGATRKSELEIQGRNIVWRMLDGLYPLFDELGARGWDQARLSTYSAQVAKTLGLSAGMVGNAYDALHALTDFVSGSTDRYAVKIADMLGRG
jgi:dGTPase